MKNSVGTYKESILIGNRIPKDFFITTGKGESNIDVHCGSYHLALRDAGIEMCNIMTYSSILPGIAREVKRPKKLVHGSVMETIMAVANSEKGELASAGIIFGWLYDKKTKEKYGGLVCEYQGRLVKEEAERQLRASLEELYVNGYSRRYHLRDIKIISESIVPKKDFGTVLIGLCFTNYMYPVIK